MKNIVLTFVLIALGGMTLAQTKYKVAAKLKATAEFEAAPTEATKDNPRKRPKMKPESFIVFDIEPVK